jgi:DNA-binding transcriptional ArsR family regulator
VSSRRDRVADGDTDRVFVALADPTRRRLLTSIASVGPVTATALAADLPISRQAVSKHLGILDDAGLVSASRAGRETRYSVTPEPFDDARAWMQRVGSLWDRRLAALDERVRARATRRP